MSITELGALGELADGVAVIASLIFGGFPVPQSAEQTRQSVETERARAHREMERVKSPGISSWWDQMKEEFEPEFASAVERILATTDAPEVITSNQTWLLPDSPGGA